MEGKTGFKEEKGLCGNTGQGWLGLEFLKGLPEQNSQTWEQLQAELKDYTCVWRFCRKACSQPRPLNTMVFPENAGCKLPVTGDISWVSGSVIL